MDLAGTKTLGEILPLQASRADLAGKPVLFFGDQAYTYGDLQAASAAAAEHLRARGVGEGDVVGVILPNAPALVAYLFGIFRTGATVLPLNPNLTPHELSLMVEDSRARAIITTGDLAPKVESLRPLNPSLKEVIAVDPGQPLEREAGPAGSRIGGSPDQIAFLIYTAGTTGRPKGVILTHRNVLANTAQVAERTGLTPADRVKIGRAHV